MKWTLAHFLLVCAFFSKKSKALIEGDLFSYKYPINGNTLNKHLVSLLTMCLFVNSLYSQMRYSNPAGAGTVLNENNDFEKGRKNWVEIVDKRTEKSRTYKGVNGEIIVENGYDDLNYTDSTGKLVPIDPSLSPSPNGWAAPHQKFPTYLNYDGSTLLTVMRRKENKLVNEGETISFNKNCKLNGKQININNKTVQETEALFSSVIQNVDKKITFRENSIESDYIIHSPSVIGNSSNLVISEEIEFPSDCYIEKDATNGSEENGYWAGDYVIYSKEHTEKARFKRPFFYDSNPVNPSYLAGSYKLIQEEKKTRLEIIVPADWLIADSRVYPVTIDPVVTGDTTTRRNAIMESCLNSPGKLDTMNVIIPGGITITNLYVSDSYYADINSHAKKRQGYLWYSTKCFSNFYVPSDLKYWMTAKDSANIKELPGTTYMKSVDMKDFLSCCFSLSCDPQTFTLNRYLARDSGGTGCNSDYIRYDPSQSGFIPFKAYIVGRTVESADSLWSVTPDSICASTCNLTLKVTVNYGIPPYTITHPWMTGSKSAGKYNKTSACANTASTTLTLTIPDCPSTCGTISSLSIPPPVITDSCGNTVSGLTAKTIIVKPVPVVSASPTSKDICPGDSAKIDLSSCVSGTTYSWEGNNNTSGTGNINDVPSNSSTSSILVNYTVTPTANSCLGATLIVPVTVNPTPQITITPGNPEICIGNTILLSASGASSYTWNPPTGLNATKGTTVSANPTSNIRYTATGKDNNNCTSSDSVEVVVNQLPIATVSSDTSICKMDTVKLSASGGTKYTWIPRTGLDQPDSPTTNASPGSILTYSVIVTDNNGCSDTGTVAITMRTEQPSINASQDTVICNNTSVQLTATGSPDISDYLWKPSQTLSNPAVAAPIATPGETTTYIIDAWNGVCHAYDTAIVSVEQPSADFTLNPKEGIAPLLVNFTNKSTGADRYEWNLEETVVSTDKDPTHTYTSPGTYQVKLTAISSNGCTDDVTHKVTVNDISILWVPNSFTPDKDGLNDIFIVKSTGITELSMMIFDRWGELIYEWEGLGGYWDGTYKNHDAPTGIYVYILKAKGADNTVFQRTGHITLLR